MQKITLFSFLFGAILFFNLGLVQAQTPTFSQSELNGVNFSFGVTSMMYGPDGRLYVSEYPTGAIKVLSIQRNGEANYEVASVEILDGIQTMADHNDDGTLHTSSNRQVTGLTVAGTTANPIVYVSSSDVRIGSGEGGGNGDVGLDTNSGVITRFTWNGSSWDVVDLVRGLPRSEENHATNGLELTSINGTKYLIVASGGFTNAGGPSTNFVYSCEYALSGAILSIDLDAINALPILSDNGRNYIYDLPTLDDPTRANANGITDPDDGDYDGIDVNDPFGGNDGLNQAVEVPGGPVQIFSPGYRNAYDLVVTDNGALYVTDNGANPGWGGFPVNEGGGSATNNYDVSEPGSQSLSGDEQVDNLDHLELVTNSLQSYVPGSFYGGHPNPTRANPNGAGLYVAPGLNGNAGAVFRTLIYDPDGSRGTGYTTDASIALPANWPPVSEANTIEGDWRGPGTNNPDGPNDNPIAIWGTNTNGIDEYTASNFGGVMQGDLLAGHSAGNIRRAQLNSNGTLQNLDQTFLSGIGGNALGITCNGDIDIFPGTIWAGTLNGKIVVFEPTDAVICINPGDSGYDANADYDNDGYTNQDEEDNGTDPCNGGSQPDDFDKSAGAPFQSNLNDNDDDGDGILDAVDPFQLGDPSVTGSDAFTLPVSNGLFGDQQDLGGIFGLGMTGLMNNGDTGANWLDWIDRRDDPNDPNPNDVLGGAVGLMTSHMTSGTALGSTNNQEKAYQYGVQVNQNTGIFTVTGRMVNLYGPLRLYGNTSATGGELGYFIGDGTQSNYIKIVLTTNGVSVLQEVNDVPLTPVEVSLPLSKRPNTSITFYFVVNPSTGEVELQFASDGGVKNSVVSLTAQGSILNALQQSNQDLAVGFIGTSNTTGVELEGTWDFLNVSQTSPGFALRINAGGPAMDYDGENFSADQSFIGGAIFENSNALVPPLYQTERSSPSKTFQYSFPVTNGNYNVILHFADIYFGATGGGAGGIGSRIFDVSIEGALVLDNYDIIADVGSESPVIKLFNTTVVDGSLELDFSALASVGGVDQPKVAAIEVIEVSGNTAPVVQNPGNQNNSPGDNVSLAIQATDESSTLNYVATNLPTGLDINPNTGVISGVVSNTGSGSGFQESGGLVVIEAESGNLVPGWSLTSAAGATGIIAGTDSFNTQNGGTIPYEITISTPGVYRFNWRTFYSGSSPTDKNDNWLRFPNNSDVWFFGYKGIVQDETSLIANLQGSQNNIVFPIGSSRITTSTTPAGAGGDGYLKAYRSGGASETYSWQALTNDGDGYDIYVWFVNPGTYSMEISERSAGHAIDKIAMYKVDGPAYSNSELTGAPESMGGGGSLNASYNVEVTVTDDEIPPLSESVLFTWNIGSFLPISVDPIADQSNVVGDAIGSLGISASGGDSNANYVYSISGQPSGILVEPTNGLIYGTIENGALTGGSNNDGIHNVTVSVAKPGSATVNVNFVWTITNLVSCTWNDLSDPSQDRFESLSRIVGDKLYMIGGWIPGSPTLIASNQNEIYDITNDSWSLGAPMPIPVTHMGNAVVGNEIWSVGGFAGNDPGVITDVVQIYNTTTNTWSTGPNLPVPTGSGALALNNNKLYFFGGLAADRQTDVGNHYVLDLGNLGAGWTTAASLPNPRNHLSAESVNGLVYAIGGQYGHDVTTQDTKLLHVYDPSTNQWTNLADLPEERSHFEPGTSVHNGKIIIAGGRNGNNVFDEVTQYDPQLNTWSELCTLPVGLIAPTAKVFGDRLIVTGGSLDGFLNISNETIWLQLVQDVSQYIWVDKNENENYIGRHECNFVQVGNQFYLMGGRESDVVERYDYSSDTWTALGSAPKFFSHFQAIEYQGLVWVIGAIEGGNYPYDTPNNHIWMYDPLTDDWIQGPEIPAERVRGSTGAVLYNDKFYIVGGNTNGHAGGYVSWFDEFDPATGTWLTLDPAPRARDHFHAVLVGDKMYAIGGRQTGDPGDSNQTPTELGKPLVAEVDVYDFSTGLWTTLPSNQNIPTPRAGPAAVNFNNKVVVIGGEVYQETVDGVFTTGAVKVSEEFDPNTGVWTRMPDLNYQRHGHQAIVSGNGIHAIAGSPIYGGATQKNMEYFGEDSPVGSAIYPSSLSAPTDLVFGNNTVQDVSLDVSGGDTGIWIRSMEISGPNASDFIMTTSILSNTLLKANSINPFGIQDTGSGGGRGAVLTIEYGVSSSLQINLTTTASCGWNDLTDSNLGRFETRSEKLGDKLYIFGGWLPGILVAEQVEIYDTSNDTWSFGAPMPVPVTHMGSAVVGNEIWIIGGFAGDDPAPPTQAVQIYDTVTNTWSTGPDLPNLYASGAATLNGNKIHYFGGLLPDRQTDVGDHYVLDLANIGGGWTTAAPMPNPRNHHSAESVNGIVYAIGGQFGHDTSKQFTKLLHAYDPNTDQWTNLSDLPAERSHFEPGTTVHNGKIIIAGGQQSSSILNEVTKYDPQLDVWTELCTLPENLFAPVAQVFGDRLIVSSGGVDGFSNLTLSTRWLQLEAEESHPPITLDQVANKLNDELEDIGTIAITASGGNLYDIFTFGISGQPTGITINAASGVVTGTIGANAASGGTNNDGVYSVTISASKLDSQSTTMQFQWTVSEPAAGVVWLEDFENLTNGATADNGSTAWSSVRDAGTFAVSNGTFLTNGNSASPGVWTSEVISINGTISISMDVDDADNNKEPADFVRAYYVLDGGPQVLFGSVVDDISAQTFTISGLSGSTVQIIVETDVSTSTEFYTIDNVTVSGDSTGTTEYNLTVDNGMGDGSYEAGTVVNIVADGAPSGQEFDIWTGDVAGISDVNSLSTTITMPSSNILVTASYRDIQTSGILWLEDFEDLANGATSDNGATAWTSIRNSGTFEVSNGAFLTHDFSSTPGIWTSEVIPINGTVSLSIDVDDGDDKKEPNDFVRAYYIVDGGQQILFGSVSDDISAQTFTASGITGSTIQIVVEAVVSYFDEFYFVDNVTVFGEPTETTEYNLTVDNGSGDGQYESGTTVNIIADVAPSGQEFDIWTGDVAAISDVNSPSTTINMPSSNTIIAANYRVMQTGGVIWLEDFEDLSNGATSDNGSTAWTSVRDASTFAVSNGTFLTNGNSASPGVWTSEVISISGTISISMDVDDADNNKEPADFVRAYYVLDGGPQVLFGSVVDDISAQTFMISGLSGSTVQIIVETDVSTISEFYTIDNIAVIEEGASGKNFNGVSKVTADELARNETLTIDSGKEIHEYIGDSYIFPNPTSGFINVRLANRNILNMSLYDLTGKQVQKYKGSDIINTRDGVKLSIGSIRNGVYMIQLVFENFDTKYLKVVIQN